MIAPITKLLLLLRNWYAKKTAAPETRPSKRNTIEKKWWMSDDVFTDEQLNKALKRGKFY